MISGLVLMKLRLALVARTFANRSSKTARLLILQFHITRNGLDVLLHAWRWPLSKPMFSNRINKHLNQNLDLDVQTLILDVQIEIWIS